ncbi:glycine cleavage H-protein [Chloroherpeton thalassium ATCC 35110]|uniref:Glycine cleavage H-protein n=1 Tax=Chloroherpeton thalassium (strain ATCC 35110 / GB-78) TaxID=517418 RepID=B3QSV7_CHLT3|nr:glycine cleavage system protein H [Chloroherpeton thalassium]ACF12600.1 glycine cleavage H-protein [Chloroherpeton thalassium ATCC 35110]
MSRNEKLKFPEDRFYDSRYHFWAKPDPTTGNVVIGIDALGLDSAGELVYMSFHSAGSRVRRHESLGSLEAAKMTGEILSPVSGTIIQRNTNVLEEPSIVNAEPYGRGWFVLINPDNWHDESKLLVSGNRITSWAKGEMMKRETESIFDR